MADLALAGPLKRVAAQGRYVYVVTFLGAIHVVDASVPAAPRVLGRLGAVREDEERPTVDANPGILYVAHTGWLQAVDVRDPVHPREIAWAGAASLGVHSRLTDVSTANGLVYLATESDGLVVVELHLPVSASTILLPSIAQGG